jgi:flagellar FliJ protein
MNTPVHDPSLSPLLALLGQAERERDTALANVQKALAAQRAAEAQSQQLVAYRLDYETKYRERFSRQGAIDVFQSYQNFMGRLTLAVEQQNGVVEGAGRRVDQAAEALREQELRVASVRKLLERRMAELRQATGRREQKQTDEFASRAAWNRLAEQRLSPSA